MLSEKKSKTMRWVKILGAVIFICCYAGSVFADQAKDITGVATAITGNFQAIGKLMVAISYLSGFGFTIASIFKFKQHKDNPTQVPMGTPLALLVVGIILVFIPALIKIGGGTAGFGEESAGGFKGGGVTNVPGSSS